MGRRVNSSSAFPLRLHLIATRATRVGPERVPLSRRPRAKGMRLLARWSLKHQLSLTCVRRVTLVVADGVGIAQAGIRRVTRIVADSARIRVAGHEPIAGVVLNRGTRVARAGEVPDAGVVPHGTRVVEAGLVPVAGIILENVGYISPIR